MKKKVFILVSVLLSTFISVIGSSQANAGDCSASDPCGTWAVLDTQGTVTNVIVCQASVCGAGSFGGQTVVPQVAPNPTTHDTANIGSYIGNTNEGTKVVYSQGIFEIHQPSVIHKSETEILLGDAYSSTVVSSVEIPILSKTFTYNDTIENSYGNVPMSIKDIDNSKKTILTVNKIENEENITESTFFYGKKTDQEIIEQLVRDQLNLINSKIQSLLRLLSGFIK